MLAVVEEDHPQVSTQTAPATDRDSRDADDTQEQAPTTVTTPEMVEAAMAMRTRSRTASSSNNTSTSTAAGPAAESSSNKTLYSAADYYWGAKLMAVIKLAELEKKPIEHVIEAVPLSLQQRMMSKVKLEGQPMRKAMYVDEDEIPVHVLAEWRAAQVPAKVYEMVVMPKAVVLPK
jgi:hypothetical protein